MIFDRNAIDKVNWDLNHTAHLVATACYTVYKFVSNFTRNLKKIRPHPPYMAMSTILMEIVFSVSSEVGVMDTETMIR